MDGFQLFDEIVVAVWSATFLAVPVFLLAFIATALFRGWLPPWARQAVWSLVLLRLLIPDSVVSPLSLQGPQLWCERVCARVTSTIASIFSAPVVELPHVITTEAAPLDFDDDATTSEIVPEIPQVVPIDWIDIVLTKIMKCSVAISVLLGMFWSTITTVRLRRLIQSSEESQRPDWLELLEEGQRLFEADGPVALRTVSGLTSPATYGWWRPAILLPDDAETWSIVELRHVFWHELAHIRRHDVAASWVLALVRVLHSWNPMFWWAQSAWLAERELACDALVLRRLDRAQSSEYGKTLLRFLERMTAREIGPLSPTTPGFLMFFGRKRAVRRRLEQLSELAKPVRSWRKGLAWLLIIVLGVTGLTDATVPPERGLIETSLELPAGTIWKPSMSTDFGRDEIKTIVSYDLSAAIARLRRGDRPFTDEEGAELFLGQLQRIVGALAPKEPLPAEQPQKTSPSTTSKVERRGNLCDVTATKAQHVEIQQILNHWTASGLRGFRISIKQLSTPVELKELLPETGGQILSPESLSKRHPIEQAANASSTAALSQCNIPTFMQIMTPQETQSLMKKLSTDVRNQTVSSPIISTIEGNSASLVIGTNRPFVTGLRSRSESGNRAEVTTVEEGIKLEICPDSTFDLQATRLRIRYQQSEVEDVEVLKVETTGTASNVQIPHLSRSVVNVDTSVPLGHSLLVVPLRRDRNGELHLCLFQPTVLQ